MIKKIILVLLLLASVCYADKLRKYRAISIQDLPAGSTIYLQIRGTGQFGIDGDTYTLKTISYIVPRQTTDDGDYDFKLKVSSMDLILIFNAKMETMK